MHVWYECPRWKSHRESVPAYLPTHTEKERWPSCAPNYFLYPPDLANQERAAALQTMAIAIYSETITLYKQAAKIGEDRPWFHVILLPPKMPQHLEDLDVQCQYPGLLPLRWTPQE